MGQLVSFVRSIWYISRCSSDTESIDMEITSKPWKWDSTPRGSTPRGSTPRGSTLRGSTPRGSTLRGSTPRGSTLRGSTPRGSTPRGSTLRGSTPRGSTPRGSTLRGSTLRGSTPRGRGAHASPIAGSTVGLKDRQTVKDLKLTDHELSDLLQRDPGTERDLKLSDPHLTSPKTDHYNTETHVDLKPVDPKTTDIEDDLKLSESQIEALARDMEARKMKSIAISDLGIGIETVNNLQVIRQGNYVAFTRDLLVLWREQKSRGQPGSGQYKH